MCKNKKNLLKLTIKCDNPAVDLILCAHKSDKMANYTLEDKSKRIFEVNIKFSFQQKEKSKKK